MKILVAEYVVGGGLAAHTIPASLAREGAMMLQALVAELNQMDDVEISVMLDWRFDTLMAEGIDTILVAQDESFIQKIEAICSAFDVFWPIAPESDAALEKLVAIGQKQAVRMPVSSLATIRLCSHKLQTLNQLAQTLAVPETYLLSEFNPQFPPAWVIKPVDGAGCEETLLLGNEVDFTQRMEKLADPEKFIVQTRVTGRALSLSALFKAGQGRLLSVNAQQMRLTNKQFQLTGCRVNIVTETDYQPCIDVIAQALPGLWGYVGIDLIESAAYEYQILEINPRLTTSYTALQAATGINVAEQVLRLFGEQLPKLALNKNTVSITLK